jgi:tetratricopeptide (TPR) repeat protein
VARALLATEPHNARARLAAGIALRGLGQLETSRSELEEAARLQPSDYAIAYELGLLHEALGDDAAAASQFERAAQLRPAFAPARYAAGAARLRRREWTQAAAAFEATLAIDPANAEARRALSGALAHAGRECVARGEFAAASRHFHGALAHDKTNAELAMYIAQADLLLGRWVSGWAAYRARPTRVAFERQRTQEGQPYRVPPVEALRGRGVRILGDQGLGDILFMLRFVPRIERATHVDFVGDARLHSLLARTSLFRRFEAERVSLAGDIDVEILAGDLPLLVGSAVTCPPSLAISADPHRASAWARRLEALGPRPWIGITWRAGTAKPKPGESLAKSVPIETLLAPLRGAGTVVSLQNAPTMQDLDEATRILGTRLHNLAVANEDLEEALALLSVLDRYAGVSNTNVHLRALAGKPCEVCVPFPYEWRWGVEGESPWFPGSTVRRQSPGGAWPG